MKKSKVVYLPSQDDSSRTLSIPQALAEVADKAFGAMHYDAYPNFAAGRRAVRITITVEAVK